MKKTLILFFLAFSFLFSRADEGMWFPIFLKYNEAEMQKMGFKLTAEDIYSVNKHSLKDAVMLFGGGCTAELISDQGLILTNHHCGYSYVQSHSTLENNYLHNGFWAKSKKEEIANPGLKVTFLVRMEDVTVAVLKDITDKMSEQEREIQIAKNINKLRKEAVKDTHYEAVIKPFFYGNQYFLFVNEVFKDVRLVGTPPENIGKFGGDTDNWMWPRHTGDFSLYRIYMGKDGKPAEYSEDNIPYKPKKHLSISLKGVSENDFTFVFGYPGTTMQFLTSDGIDLIANYRNPPAIHQRGRCLDIMKKYMDKSIETRLMYSAKANSISNGWKKWIGENKGIFDCNVIDKKKAEEVIFSNWVNENDDRKERYGAVLSKIKNAYKEYLDNEQINVYIRETFFSIEIFDFAHEALNIIRAVKGENVTDSVFEAKKKELTKKAEAFYKEFYKPIDKEIFVELLHYYFSTIPPKLIPAPLQKYINISKNTLAGFADEIYEKSIFASQEIFLNFVKKAKQKDFIKLEKQLIYQLLIPASDQYISNYMSILTIKNRLEAHYRTYVKALMEMQPDKHFYPDANLTLRVTYGNVKGFSPEDGKEYVYYTTIDGIMEKEDPDVFDYMVDPKLKQLYETKDYGKYTNKKGELPVAFIASNHTTGGNSGSPVLNGKGELVGVNFDRVWEGTMSDVNYDVSRCRNISLDIRYFLFIVDKFANAQNIMNELNIVD